MNLFLIVTQTPHMKYTVLVEKQFVLSLILVEIRLSLNRILVEKGFF